MNAVIHYVKLIVRVLRFRAGYYKRLAIFYVAFCLVGGGLEWAYGKFWSLVGTTPWTYPNSPFEYTGLERLPLWGFWGVVCIYVYRAIMAGKAKELLGTMLPLVLAVLWILVCG